MDPALWEVLRAGGDGDVEAIIRLRRPDAQVPAIRVVARFGRIATCRLAARSVAAVRAHHDVISLKAARCLGPEYQDTRYQDTDADSAPGDRRCTDVRRGPGLPLTGAGVVVGAVDWGLDFDHPNFKRPDGSTRLLALWDQRGRSEDSPRPYGYGRVHQRAVIDTALCSRRPYRALGYHPATSERDSTGAHGTHVLDIAAGSGTAGPAGVAPAADLVFVHLADRDTGGLANLGDSVRLLEAVDFVARTAGARPWVINVSVGRHGGPHDGSTLAELAFDELLAAAPGRFIVQSAGNYFGSRTHACGELEPGRTTLLRFVTSPADTTPNELEVWYDGADEVVAHIDPPGGGRGQAVPLGGRAALVQAGRVVGRVYHRAHDPNNGDNQIDAFLYSWAPPGTWRVGLEAVRVRNGRFHAWLERDEACGACQARFVPGDTNSTSTTGTIANSHLPLVGGAVDAHRADRPPARFSSSGPTRDARQKPDLAAPGFEVLAARSAPRDSDRSPGELVRKSGTSMATPHLAGAVALCLEAGGNRLTAAGIRDLVLGSVDPPLISGATRRVGAGYLNVARLVAAAGAAFPPQHRWKDTAMATDPETTVALRLDPARAYRELMYRPSMDLAGWINERFSIVARPGQPIGEPPRPGDLFLKVNLGRPGEGSCTVVTDSSPVPGRRMPAGGLLLRRRAPVTIEAGDDEGESPDDLAESSDIDFLIREGRPENQITNAVFYGRHPDVPRDRLKPRTRLAREWQRIRDDEVRPAVRRSLPSRPVDPVLLAAFLSQYEGDSRVPPEATAQFLTQPAMLSMGRSLRDRVIANWRSRGTPLTVLRFYRLALELSGHPGTAALLCHNVARPFHRGGKAIHWTDTGTEGEYTDGQKTFTAEVVHPSGVIKYFHKGKNREVVSLFFLLFSATEFGTGDTGDWYHFFVAATITAHGSSGTLAPGSGSRGRDEQEDGDDRGGSVGPVIYTFALRQRLADLEAQLTDPALRGVPSYRSWVLANVLSFLEGGHYGADYVKDQSDVVREGRVHLRGARFGMQTIGAAPGRQWTWRVPVAGSISWDDLATGFRVAAKTAEIWGPEGSKQAAGDAAADSADREDLSARHVLCAQRVWGRIADRSAHKQVLGKVRILDLADHPSQAVRTIPNLSAWTNSADSIYVSARGGCNEDFWELVLDHESIHIVQYQQRGGRPPTKYAEMMRYECDAYSQSADVAKREELPEAEKEFRAAATLLCTEIAAAKKARLSSTKLEARYCAFLVRNKFLTPHTRLADLYAHPRTPASKTAEAVESTDGDDDDYGEILRQIRAELNLPFADPTDPGLVQRRRRLRALFGRVPQSRARELHDRLGPRATGDELSRLFHGRLATATRQELLGILRGRFPSAQPPPPPSSTPALIDPFGPLPPDAQGRFDAAAESLRAKIAASSDPRAWRYRCWLAKLASGADDRLVPWFRICPRTSGAVGAAFVVGPCDITAGSAVDQAELQAAVRSVADVEAASQRLRFLLHLRSRIVWTFELTSEQFHLDSFRRFHDEVQLAIRNLDLWANAPMGGSSAMPPAYVSIKDWIGRQQRNPSSLYSCM